MRGNRQLTKAKNDEPYSRNDDTFAYNARGEVTFAEIAANVEEHAYDSIGNSLRASFNSVTNHYTANNLNQYTRNPATAPTECRTGRHDAPLDADRMNGL